MKKEAGKTNKTTGTGAEGARPELPKKSNSIDRDETGVKGARPELPKKAPKTDKKTAWWVIIARILALVVGTGATVIAVQLFTGNLLLAIVGAEELSSPTWSAIYSALSYIITMLILVVAPVLIKRIWRKKETRGEKRAGWKKVRDVLGLRGWPTWTDIGLAPIGYIAYMVLGTAALTVFTNLFPWFNAGEAQSLGFSYSVAGWDRAMAFTTLVIVAPIAEEIVFRGWLYEKIKRELRGRVPKWVEVTVAILLTSVLFGWVHLQWNVGVNVFALSIVLCLLREITGTTYSGMLLHMLKNGIAFYLLYIIGV